ncbi:preprotein translocase subunit SecG [Agriterribacter sp.]|uniref:preprotein translocase subunit SecG n=1 Tax=Agriterribacter sp. TaxID=2821509 RepID=UPI002C53D17C|nr:preprotein translocase subunit SecG [Agriterribacter sp.]HTN05761.1 preprotein translocase subunit SecG [Agriterribacter sp.]
MTLLFLILIIICSVVLGLIILIQNPKGGGLSGSIAGFSNQFMGVKQTTDVLEKGTWIFSGIIGVLCLFSTFFMGSGDGDSQFIKGINTNQQQQPTLPAPQPQQTTPQETPAQPQP